MDPRELAHNALGCTADRKGYVSFTRFFPQQLRAVEPDAMWRAMSDAATGVYLGFLTDGNRLTLQFRPHSVFRLLLPVARQVKPQDRREATENMKRMFGSKAGRKVRVDGVDFTVDGVLSHTAPPKRGTLRFAWENPQNGLHEIRVYLPLLLGGGYRGLKVNGSVRPLPAKKRLLCLGDSITQGFVAGSPSLCYVSRLAAALGADALNQGIGGHIYQPESLDGLQRLDFRPDAITVAYGTNDWHQAASLDTVRERIRAYYDRLTALFPDTPVFAVSPLWRADLDEPRAHGEPLTVLRELLAQETARYPNVRVVDGFSLMAHDASLFEDGFLHPNADGFAQIARALEAEIVKWTKDTTA